MNSIPLERRQSVVTGVIGRLHDKTSLVRKDACRLLSKFITTHPFWLDGGALDGELFARKLAELDQKLTVWK